MAEPTVRHAAIIKEAKDRFKRGMEYEATARIRARDDNKFANGDAYNNYQWPAKLYSARFNEDRPALTINKVQQHNLQIINDMRQNKASVSVRPAGGGATYQAAQCFMGIIRHIEYQSNATTAYEKGGNDQVVSGIGYWTVETDYVSADSFDQEIYIRRVGDWESVLLDCDISEYDGSDANWGFVFSDMPLDEYESTYGSRPIAGRSALDATNWISKDHIRIAKYYRREMKPDTLFATDDGTTILASKARGTPMLAELRASARRGDIRNRKILSPQIEVFKIAGGDVIEESEWAGAYVPIVRCVGIETVIDGVLDRKGHTRCMINAQQMYNFWSSAAVEFGALQTKAPWVSTAEAIEGQVPDWSRANISNPAVLIYNGFDEQGRPIPAPFRAQPPTTAPAYMAGMQTAAQELLSVTGQYQAELGMPGNETSGVAIGARQRQSNNATYHFVDHYAQAIRYTGRILVDLIPKIYDTKRVVSILAEDGSDVEAAIDPDHPAAHELLLQYGQPVPDTQNIFKAAKIAQLIFNPNVGRYDVQADVGPNFGTQREEAFAAFSQIVAQNHELINVVGDIMFKNADFPGANEIAERLAEARNGSTVPAAAMQQAQAQLQQLHGMLQQTMQALADEKAKTGEKEQLRQIEATRAEVDEYRAQTDRMAVVGKIDPAALLPIIRQMVSDVMGEPALPHIAMHQAVNGAMMPREPAEPSEPPPNSNPPAG